jgi:outer membrane protein OmpA-like peptidoglycan-associated protein
VRLSFKFFILIGVLLPLRAIHAQTVEWASEVLGVSSEKKVEFPVGSGKFLEHVYRAEQVLGKPNKCPATGDSPCAWLPENDPDQGPMEEWIKVGYARPMRIAQVGIAENFYPGAVEKVILFDDHDHARGTFSYTPASDGILAKVQHITFEKTPYPVGAVEVVLQPGLVPGPNEIDAIGISDSPTPIQADINVAPDVATIGRRENLGAAVNSPFDEVLPVISPDGKTLYVDRKNHPGNYSNNDNIWFSNQNADGNWQPLQNIGPTLNNGLGSFVASVTPDGNTLLLGGTYRSKGPDHFGLWLTHRTTSGWAYPKEVLVKDFYTKAKFVEFCLSNDGRTIILSLDRADSYGGKDLYVSFLQPDGTWSAPKDLGFQVNSAADEATPFLASDGRTLYFSSEGFPGYGDMDMFITRRLDDTWQNWTEPQNLGSQLNTPSWDAYYTVPASGEYAYFVSTENSFGMGDIFRVKLPSALKPKPVVLISGKVIDAKTGKPLNANIKYEILSNGKEVGGASTSPVTGVYKITLPSGENYGYRAEAPGYVPVSENLDLTKETEYRELERNLTLVPIEKGETVRLNNIFFETAKADLQQESFAELDRVVKLLEDNPTMEILISGHTDSTGSPALNKQLSEARAKAVQTYLIGKSVSAKRLQSKGFGDAKPIAPNSTDAGRQQNRRVEFTILKQ